MVEMSELHKFIRRFLIGTLLIVNNFQPVGNILCTYNYYLFVVLNMINNVLGISKYTYNYVSLFFLAIGI